MRTTQSFFTSQRAILPTLLVLASGCIGEAGLDGRTGLVSLEYEPPGQHCGSGGVATRSGIDHDGDGILDPNEVTSTRYLCHGENGTATLFEIDEEPPGERCPAGGKAIAYGLDTNGDGLLGEEEITGTDYVCHGEAARGRTTLVSVVPEPAGTNCSVGGQAIRTGTDLDDDGVLQPAEVESTSYVCHGEGAASLVRAVDEPAGARCPSGGQQLLMGTDGDGDGYLHTSEVTSSAVVCNGARGAATLIELTREPAGVRCATGGVRIHTGLDTNGDGLLGSLEVRATSYVCDGNRLVVRTSIATWGGVCPRGGARVETGTDLDADGTLDDAEVEREEYVCHRYVVAVATGGNRSCALVSDGTVRCWGSFGGAWAATPVTIENVSGATQLAAGRDHTCALLVDGTARCWGENIEGRLGDGTTSRRPLTAVAVVGLPTARHLAAGHRHTCAVLTTGEVRCWGSNEAGQLGNGTTTGSLVPVTVVGLSSAVEVALGAMHSCARLADGTVRCWGGNSQGTLGDGTTTDRRAPVEVLGLRGVTQLSTRAHHTCARLDDGAAYCWGADATGQLGDGVAGSIQPSPVRVLLEGIAQIAAGGNHTCAVRADRSSHCWGANYAGALGDGTMISRATPAPLSGLGDTTHVDSGESHGCALRVDGSLRCWGQNGSGQLGDGTTTNRTIPVSVELPPLL